jgi:chromate transport protein ChrA
MRTSQSLYLSSVQEPAKKSLWDQRKLLVQIAAAVVVMVLSGLAADVLSSPVITMIIVAALVFVGFKGFQLNQAMQPDPMGANPYRVADVPGSKAQQQAVSTTVELPEHVIDDSNEDAATMVFKHHWLEFFRESRSLWFFVVPVVVLAMLPVVLSGVDNQESVKAALKGVAGVAAAIAALAAWRGMKRLMWPPLVIGIISGATLAALMWSQAMMFMVALLLLVALWPVARRWAQWYHTEYIISATDYTIRSAPPKIFFLGKDVRWIDLVKVESVAMPTPAMVDMFPVDAGCVCAETDLQEDQLFSENPHIIKHNEQMAEVIDRRRKLLQAG